MKQRYGTYKGEFREGKKDGKGKFYYQSELRYEGDYKDNKKEGLGKVVNRNETIAYEG